MEAFEHVVRVFLEGKGHVVSTNVKFPVKRRTKKAAYEEYQTHGYEVDIVAARGDSLLLGSVKSFFGSGGVSVQGFAALANGTRKTFFPLYKMFNETDIRDAIATRAAERYGYQQDQVRFGLFVGNFRRGHEERVRSHLESLGVLVVGLEEISEGLLQQTRSKTYVDDPVVMALKSLDAAGHLKF